VLVTALCIAGLLTGTAGGAASGMVELKDGDTAVFDGVQCTAGGEAGIPDLLCQSRSAPKYQAQIYANSIFVWKVGNPDDPVYSTSSPSQTSLQAVFKKALCGACKAWKFKFAPIRLSKLDDHFAFGGAEGFKNGQGVGAVSFLLFKAGANWKALTWGSHYVGCGITPGPIRREFRIKC
jgi:hypothetical protein